jgi:hypothetical protein
MQLQNQTVRTDIASVRTQVEDGTREVRNDIHEASVATSRALQTFQTNCRNTIGGLIQRLGSVSQVTVQT